MARRRSCHRTSSPTSSRPATGCSCSAPGRTLLDLSIAGAIAEHRVIEAADADRRHHAGIRRRGLPRPDRRAPQPRPRRCVGRWPRPRPSRRSCSVTSPPRAGRGPPPRSSRPRAGGMTGERLDWIRLTLRLHRFELIAFGTAIIALVVASFAVAAYIDGFRLPPECLTLDGETTPFSCQEAFRSLDSARTLGALITSPVLLVTYAIGLFLGVPVIARELERGTVRLAWWLAPSRWRWYLARLLPVLVVLAWSDLRRRDRDGPVCSPRTTRARPLECVRRLRGPRRAAGEPGASSSSRSRSSWARSSGGRCRPSSSPRCWRRSACRAAMTVHQSDPGQRGRRDPARPVPGQRHETGRHVHRSEVRPAGRHARRLRVFQRRAIRTTRTGNSLYPQVDAGRSRASATGSSRRARLSCWRRALVALFLAGFVVSRRRPG